MFMTRSKSKGRYYYYFYVYDCSSERGMRPVFSLGNSEKALDKLSNWQEQNYLPIELIDLGIRQEQIGKWLNEIEENNKSSNNVACCSYKVYNKNRKRPPAPTEAFF